MTPFTLVAHKETEDTPPSISVYKRNSECKLATLFGDDTIVFNSYINYESDEIKCLSDFQTHFFTLFNSLIDKDEEIRELKLSINPIIHLNSKK